MVDSIRSYFVSPQSIRDPLIGPNWGGLSTSTGIAVNETTALNYSPVWAAVALISGDVAHLPLVLYRRSGSGMERYVGHPLYRLLHDAPNPECTSMVFRRTLQACALTWGNGYAEIERDGGGRPVALWPIETPRVGVERTANGMLRYRVYNPNGPDTFYAPNDMLHIRGLGDDTCGYSVISRARESMGLGLAAERFGGSFYGNGSTFGGVLSHQGRLSKEARENIQDSIAGRHQGVDRAHKLFVIEEGMTYTQIGVPPNDAQFLETRQFQVREVARWFGVPAHKIGDLERATFSNIEQQNIEYYQTTLVHWLETWEQELMAKLIAPSERNLQVIEHVTDGLLRGDSAGRAALETAQFSVAGITPNEIRALDNRNPLAGGDRAFVQINNVWPLDRVDDYVNATIDQMKAAAEASRAKDQTAQDVADRDVRIAELETREAEARASAAAAIDNERMAYSRVEVATAAIAQAEQARDAAVVALNHRAAHAATLEADVAERTAQLEAAVFAKGLAEHEKQVALDRAALAHTEKVASLADVEQLRALIAEKDARVLSADDAARVAGEALIEARTVRDANVLAISTLQAKADAEAEARAGAERVAEAATAEAQRQAALAEDFRVVAQTSVDRAQAERDEAIAKALEHEERSLQLADQVTLIEGLLSTATGEHAQEIQTLRNAFAAVEQERDSARLLAEGLVARVDAVEAEHQAAVVASAALRAEIIAANRVAILDALQSMVKKEVDRAKDHRASKKKLRDWAERFDATYRPVCCVRLRPAIKSHMALLGSSDDLSGATEAVVAEHLSEFHRQIDRVLDSDDSDYQAMLDHVLRTWEADHADAMTDVLIRKEIEHVRTL